MSSDWEFVTTRANEQRLAFLLALNDALQPLSDPAVVLETASRLLSEQLGAVRVGYAELEHREYIIRHEHSHGGGAPLVGRLQGLSVGTELSAALRRGETVVVTDLDTDPRLDDDARATVRSRQIVAFIAVARMRDGQMLAVFGANSVTPRLWTASEIDLVRDVAYRTWDALERARAEAALHEQKQRLHLALEASAGGSWTWNPATNEVDWDERFRSLYGFAPDEPATPEAWPSRVHEDDRPRLMAALSQILTSTTKDSWENTFRIIRPDGTVGWIQSRGRAERGGDGRVTQLTGLDLDFTQHRRAEEALQARREGEHDGERQRAALALQARTDELEFRTRQLSQMASDLTLAEHHAREQLARTIHDGLQQLLVIAALSIEREQKRELDNGIAPSDLLSDARRSLDEAMAAARSLTFELNPPVLHYSGLPAALRWLAGWTQEKHKLDVQIDADPLADSPRKDIRALLFESVRELVFNVVKHAEADRVTLELALDGDDQLCITVADQGIGFDPARLDERSRTGPVGWGLFSIRERLALLGGRVDIESTPGRGTRVRIVAPRAPVEAASPVREAATSTPIGLAPLADQHAPSGPLRILIVDDHTAVKKTLRKILHERPQLSVVGEACTGTAAIDQVRVLRPDVILMDVVMPGMDGIEATARIHAEFPDIEILGLSTHPRGESVHAIEQAGAADFFVKGVDTQRLIDRLLLRHAARGART